ncbi:MAG: cupin domain-containing protein [Pseudohongiellaceae bacterium]
MRAISDLLQLIRLQVSIYHNAKVCGNWHIREHQPGQTCFHLVTTGSCRLEIPGRLNTILHNGDLLLFPREIAHSMSPVVPLTGHQQHLSYRQADSLDGTGMLCAEVIFRHRAAQHLLASLPELLLIRCDERAPWLEPLTGMILRESLAESATSQALLDRLCELLFAYGLSHYMESVPRQPGLLALHAHPRIAQALDAIHLKPECPWTLAALASEAAQSRTLFAATFKALSGWTAMQYVIWWRMQLAWASLESGCSVGETAEKVGYQSQAAFSRAFKKHFAIGAGEIKQQSKRHPGSAFTMPANPCRALASVD